MILENALVRRNKFTVAAVTAVALALMLGIVVSTWQAVRATHAEKKARDEAAKSQQVAHFLKDMLNGVGPAVALGRDTHMLREILDQTAARLDTSLKNQPAVEADLRATLGNVYYDLGEFTNAAAMCRKSFELRKELHGLEYADTASSLNDWGESLRRQGKSNEAEPLIREALKLRRKLLGDKNLDVACSLDSLGFIVAYSQGKWPEAEKMLRESLAIRQELVGTESLKAAGSLENLGALLQDYGKAAEAESVKREALRIHINLLGKEHPDVASSLHNLAWSLYQDNKLVESEATFREALAMRKKMLGNVHPDVAATLINLGSTLFREKKFTEAEPVLREALGVYRKVFGSDHPSVAGALNSLADTLRSEGKLGESESLYRQALTIKTESYGYWHPPANALLYRLGLVQIDEGKFDEAVITFQQAADEGSQFAKVQLGRMYENGKGVLKSTVEADKWLRKLTESKHAQSLNQAAWKLATSEDETQRSGKWAVALAERAVELTERKNSGILDTLAASFAEAGQFKKAISTQKEAIFLLTNEQEKKDFNARLKLYESNTPCRSPD